MVKLRKSLEQCIFFAKFCMLHKCEPIDLAELITLTDKSKQAWERGNDKAEHEITKEIRRLAWRMGFEVYWAGLYPTLRKDGYDYYLPS